MRLSREEETFLRHWMYDEVHYHKGTGPAKRLQLEHRASPADLALFIAAAFPDLTDQEAAGFGPPPAEALAWPWSDKALRSRLAEARVALAERHGCRTSEEKVRADYHLFTAGIQYYIAARFAALADLNPVTGNLYHHAVEMLLKGQLAKTHTLEDLKKKFGHRLLDIWEEFKKLFPGEDLSSFEDIVVGLDRFEDIRYPDNRLWVGMYVSISWHGPGRPRAIHTAGRTPPRYELVVTDLDRLMGHLFKLCSINPAAYLGYLNEHVVRVLQDDNPVCQGWFPEKTAESQPLAQS